MKVKLQFNRLSLQISIETQWKPVRVRGHWKVTKGGRIHVKPYFRK